MSEPEWIYSYQDIENPTEKLCQNCGEKYESYLIFVADSTQAAIIHTHLENEFENLCRDCRDSLSKEFTNTSVEEKGGS